jgi:hypothetical protein
MSLIPEAGLLFGNIHANGRVDIVNGFRVGGEGVRGTVANNIATMIDIEENRFVRSTALFCLCIGFTMFSSIRKDPV